VPRISRRSLLVAAVLAPAALAVDEVVHGAARGMTTVAASLLRPPRSGSSSRRCGRCGGGDHAMLDPRCPSAPMLGRGRN
jgi:hypothetical protein